MSRCCSCCFFYRAEQIRAYISFLDKCFSLKLQINIVTYFGFCFSVNSYHSTCWVVFGKCIGKNYSFTNYVNDLLTVADILFGLLAGMNKESKEFAGELFDALTRRRNITGELINKSELKEFREQICNQSFDSRLWTFFDMWVGKYNQTSLAHDASAYFISNYSI